MDSFVYDFADIKLRARIREKNQKVMKRRVAAWENHWYNDPEMNSESEIWFTHENKITTKSSNPKDEIRQLIGWYSQPISRLLFKQRLTGFLQPFRLEIFQYFDYNFCYRNSNQMIKMLYKDDWRGCDSYVYNFFLFYRLTVHFQNARWLQFNLELNSYNELKLD